MVKINRLLICLCGALILAGPLQAAPLRMRLNQVMTEREIKGMGLDFQSPTQRRQLEAWLTQYTRKIQQQQGAQPVQQEDYFLKGTNLEVAPRSYEEEDNPKYFHDRAMPRSRILSPPNEPSQVVPQQRTLKALQQGSQYNPFTKLLAIDIIEDDGLTIKLSDRSVWSVNLLHRDRVTYWRPEHRIHVYRGSNAEYPYRLVNLNLNEWAEVNLTSPPPTGAVDEQAAPPERTIKIIKEILGAGAQLKLDDGSAWEIAPWHKYRAKVWLPEEGVKVMRNDSPSYPFRLINVDSQESIEARQAN